MVQLNLTQADFDKIEAIYDIKLPNEFKQVYANIEVDIPYFYAWNDFSSENVARIKARICQPKEDLINSLDEFDWLEDRWGEEPSDITEKNARILQMIANAPQILPIAGHRYIAEGEGDISPVISIVGLDCIYYAPSLTEFVATGGDYHEQQYLYDYVQIPFWTDVMEQ